jgi:poly(3-hydroxybutyrate) depolymerase
LTISIILLTSLSSVKAAQDADEEGSSLDQKKGWHYIVPLKGDHEGRKFYVRTPWNFKKILRHRVLILLPEAGQTVDELAAMSHFDESGPANSFVTVFAEASPSLERPAWNAAHPKMMPSWYSDPGLAETNDVDYVRQIIDFCVEKFGVDNRFVYVLGFGANGGAMAQRLACQLSDKVTAIGQYQGASFIKKYKQHRCRGVLADMDDTSETYEFSKTKCSFDNWKKFSNAFKCKQHKEIPVLFMSGLKDETLPTDGRVTLDSAEKSFTTLVPQEYSWNFWKHKYSCLQNERFKTFKMH